MTDFFNVQEMANNIKGISTDDYQEDQRSSESADPSEADSLSYYDRQKLNPFIFSTSQVFQYPLTVGENEEQPHSVRFYINARSNSRVAETTNKEGVSAKVTNWGPLLPEYQNTDKLETVDSTAENRLTAEQGKSVGNTAAAVAAFGLTRRLAGKGASELAKTGAGLLGAYAGAELTDFVIETTSKVRTLGAIELYVAAPPVAQYSANWENKELGALAGAPDLSKQGILEAVKGLGELGLRGAIKAAASLPGEFGIGGELGAALDLASGKVANPYKEQLFSNMGFRQFAFNYKFNPRNKTEYENVQRIIQLFKYHMHPEVSPNRLFLEYPSEFEIEYHYKGTENRNVSKISTCALTDVKITYGNQDAFTTIKDMNGAPAEINMQLAFTELETLTNERIADGY